MSHIIVWNNMAENNTPSILIIDDDPWMQRLISTYLKNWGFEYYSALNPIEGISQAIKLQPNIIILDILLPEVKGDVLLKMFKNIEITAKIPVIIISGNFSKDILSSVYKHGANAFISKPISEMVLCQKIKECLDDSSLSKLSKTWQTTTKKSN